MTIDIVPIRIEHAESFHRALDLVARERRWLAMTEAPSIESTRAFVADNIARGNPQFVVLENEKLVGWCDVVRSAQPTAAHCGVLGIALSLQYRGQGIGRRLMGAALKKAQARGFSRVELTVHADNHRAINLYERVGFAHEGIKRKARRIGDSYKDVVLMAIIDLDTWMVPADIA